MPTKKPLFEVPVPSTDFVREATYLGATIRYEYIRGDTAYRAGIRFVRAAATRSRSERACTAWHIEGSYDTLVEVEDSPWVDEIRADTSEPWRSEWPMRHFMIYLDGGCFEVLAANWEVIAEEPGSWT